MFFVCQALVKVNNQKYRRWIIKNAEPLIHNT